MSTSTWVLHAECETCRARREDECEHVRHPWEDESTYRHPDTRPTGRTVPEPYGYVWTRRHALHYLTCDEAGTYTGGLWVPCSRYGRDGDECSHVAWRVSYLTARETGEPITVDSLEHTMSLVVNDHEDVAYLVRTYGNGHYS